MRPDSIRGHVEHGKALLRNIREKHHDHNGTAFWLPVLIVSGFARERDEAVDVMKDGASTLFTNHSRAGKFQNGYGRPSKTVAVKRTSGVMSRRKHKVRI